MDSTILQNARLSAVAERQMRSWAQMQEMAAHAPAGNLADRPTARMVTYITISRESGTDGTLVARLVAEALGWNDYGQNLRDHVAQWYKEPRLMLDLVDETVGNWMYDMFGPWMDRHLITHEKFLSQVGHMIQILARRGPAVFVGRGSQFLLPRAASLAVRLVAPEAYRVERVQQRRNFATRGEARRWVRQVDSGRRDVIRRFFHHDITDPQLYDLVINVERLGTAGAAEQIVFAVRRSRELAAAANAAKPSPK